VKSTLEMKYVLQDLETQKLQFPVICGGAALNRKYVEDDLRREYSSSVFYADDAFAGLHIMEDISANGDKRQSRLAEGREVKTFARPQTATATEASQERSTAIDAAPNIPIPSFGVRVRDDFDLPEIFTYLNETALFKNQWQLKTASANDYLRLVEEKYRPVLRDLKKEMLEAGWFHPKAVYGYWPCNSEGNDIVLYDASGSGKEVQRITFPRQREGRKLCISDFFLPADSGRKDVIGLSCVTIGERASIETKKLFDAGEFTKYLYVHGLGVETAEALAEYVHKLMREELGIGGQDAARISDLFHQKYRGSRYSFGYPACPNLEDQVKIFTLLKPEENIGVRLTSGFQLEPEQSTSAIVVHHPQAKYFVA
jgi:5-methyltetrahydrofolate--homocysteine methyltransferase